MSIKRMFLYFIKIQTFSNFESAWVYSFTANVQPFTVKSGRLKAVEAIAFIKKLAYCGFTHTTSLDTDDK